MFDHTNFKMCITNNYIPVKKIKLGHCSLSTPHQSRVSDTTGLRKFNTCITNHAVKTLFIPFKVRIAPFCGIQLQRYLRPELS